MMSKEQFEQMMNKLDTLIKITASNVLQGKSLTDSIVVLSNLGIGNTEIAAILGTTTNYVGVIKSKSKKDKQKKNEKELKEEVDKETSPKLNL
jgi:hypothetical protein